MGRSLRPVGDGLIYHAINRGNNRQAVFFEDADYRAFLAALGQTQLRYPFRLFGYCLMTNHFHLLLQPEAGQSISRILQSVTVAHTWRCHRTHASLGHVWQGRFKSPVIQDDAHSLVVLRYIECNPLRAGMVTNLSDYPWSSYAAHGLGRADTLLTDLPYWSERDRTESARQAYWRKWVHTPVNDKELQAIRKAVSTGRPFGTADWTQTISAKLGIPLVSRPRGRPRKERNMN